jgi:glutamine amidotransferase
MRSIYVIGVGNGNTGSVINAMTGLNAIVKVPDTPAQILNATLVVLPGVGSAAESIDNFSKGGWLDALSERHRSQKPILGICLGAELMHEFLHEASGPGLGWLPGEVSPLSDRIGFNNGWCHLDVEMFKKTGLDRAIGPEATFFFNHGYAMPLNPALTQVVVREMPSVPALVLQDHLCAVQFHPEKSQVYGRTILRNIVEDYYGL